MRLMAGFFFSTGWPTSLKEQITGEPSRRIEVTVEEGIFDLGNMDKVLSK